VSSWAVRLSDGRRFFHVWKQAKGGVLVPEVSAMTVYERTKIRSLALEALLSERHLREYLRKQPAQRVYTDGLALLREFVTATVGYRWLLTMTHCNLADSGDDVPFLLQEWARIFLACMVGVRYVRAEVLVVLDTLFNSPERVAEALMVARSA